MKYRILLLLTLIMTCLPIIGDIIQHDFYYEESDISPIIINSINVEFDSANFNQNHYSLIFKIDNNVTHFFDLSDSLQVIPIQSLAIEESYVIAIIESKSFYDVKLVETNRYSYSFDVIPEPTAFSLMTIGVIIVFIFRKMAVS